MSVAIQVCNSKTALPALTDVETPALSSTELPYYDS
jgi:hypothetical protein